MTRFSDLQKVFASHDYKVIIASDGETRVHNLHNGQIREEIPAGGVAVTFDPIAAAFQAIYIARARTPQDRRLMDRRQKFSVHTKHGEYTLKRVAITEEDFHTYYEGYANQTLWPLCHVAFEKPEFHRAWFQGFLHVNVAFAASIRQELRDKTFIWVNDYQLCLVPKLLARPKNTVVGLFWHIPWPTWEIFRILPEKKAILESMLSCDFLAFHRGYHARNFLSTIRRELEARIDQETGRIYYKGHVTTVTNLPLGIDSDVVKALVERKPQEKSIMTMMQKVFNMSKTESEMETFFAKYKLILGVDRLDYTKGLPLRLEALDRFFEKNPKCIGKVIYLGILAPSREHIPAYQRLKEELAFLTARINRKYARDSWMPVYLLSGVFPRKELVNFYQRANVCLVTPQDDGMNLVSKEFVLAAAASKTPGMLVLSQFAGSAIDLTRALIVNPYDIEQGAVAIKEALDMDEREKRQRLMAMAQVLEEKNIYEWAESFFKQAIAAKG